MSNFQYQIKSKVSNAKIRDELREEIKNGNLNIIVGTQALLTEGVDFYKLGLVIVDEQHRFGVAQRAYLQDQARNINDGLKNTIPHLLSMTATPIPRTLALTMYGDLDLSLLDQMPTGRKKPVTTVVPVTKRTDTYETIRAELLAGRQLYVICPRINEPDPDKEKAVQAKSVLEEAKRLAKEVFPEYHIGVLHSKMTPKAKEQIMLSFAAHEIDILVATSVVEVGVNVPNATLMIIEGAERFGLSQLHQLRGRIQRSAHQPYCYLFADAKSDKTIERLRYFVQAKNGFELAEYDLALRGTGELTGMKQWGVSDIGMDALRNLKLVEAARDSAKQLINTDSTLKEHPLLQEKIRELEQLHFE